MLPWTLRTPALPVGLGSAVSAQSLGLYFLQLHSGPRVTTQPHDCTCRAHQLGFTGEAERYGWYGVRHLL